MYFLFLDAGLDVSEVKVEIGTSKTINCSVTGLPLPNVQWSRLTPGNNKKLGSASKGYSLLTFDPFKETDAGKYICSASYLDVKTNWTINVNVSEGKLNSYFFFKFTTERRICFSFSKVK